MLPRGQLFITRVEADGRRLVSWRTWVLIWVAPVLFVLAGAVLLAVAGYQQLASETTQGEVVRVYAWEGTTPFDRGTMNYAPVFRYIWSDGQPTEASTGMSHPDWNFDIGSVHEIRYFPAAKTDVLLSGPHNWAAGLIVLGIGLVTVLPAGWATLRLRRWQAGGA